MTDIYDPPLVGVSAAIFIEDDEGRLLLLQQAAQHKGNKWGPPAGKMEANESPQKTAIRETKEEIGVEVRLTGLIGIYVGNRDGNKTGIAFVFKGEIVSGKIKINKDEIRDYKYFSSENLERLKSQDLIYKSQYNLAAIRDWEKGVNYNLDIIKSVLPTE